MITLILGLALVGFLCWLVVNYIPMPAPFPTVIIVIVVILVIVYLIRLFGLDVPLGRIRG